MEFSKNYQYWKNRWLNPIFWCFLPKNDHFRKGKTEKAKASNGKGHKFCTYVSKMWSKWRQANCKENNKNCKLPQVFSMACLHCTIWRGKIQAPILCTIQSNQYFSLKLVFRCTATLIRIHKMRRNSSKKYPSRLETWECDL